MRGFFHWRHMRPRSFRRIHESSFSVSVIDQDLGISGSGLTARSGFAQITAEVAIGRVGIVLGLEVSRLARNNADWYQLLDLCSATNTLIGDADGRLTNPVYYPDAVIAGTLNRQGKTTAKSMRFTANRVGSLRTQWLIPCFKASAR